LSQAWRRCDSAGRPEKTALKELARNLYFGVKQVRPNEVLELKELGLEANLGRLENLQLNRELHRDDAFVIEEFLVRSPIDRGTHPKEPVLNRERRDIDRLAFRIGLVEGTELRSPVRY